MRRSFTLTVLAILAAMAAVGLLVLEPTAQPFWAIGCPAAAFWLLLIAINANLSDVHQLGQGDRYE